MSRGERPRLIQRSQHLAGRVRVACKPWKLRPAAVGSLLRQIGEGYGKSPAQDAGVKTGDIITAVNGQDIASSSNLSTILSTQSPGAQVTLKIVRGSQTLDIKVTLGERPVR